MKKIELKDKSYFEKILIGRKFAERYDALNGSHNDYVVRVVEKNGKNVMISQDVVPSRVNVVVNDGVITEVLDLF